MDWIDNNIDQEKNVGKIKFKNLCNDKFYEIPGAGLL